MAIFLTEKSRVVVQGMTGSEGQKHTSRMLAAGTDIVGGVTPGKGGLSVDFAKRSIPVYGSCADAVNATDADVSVIFVPPRFTKSAVIEAVDAGIPLVVRLDGNNVDEGRKILAKANHPLVTVVDTMDGAAARAAELARSVTEKGQ